MAFGMEKIIELKCTLWKDKLDLTITTESQQSYESTITQATIRPFEKQLSITLADIEEYLTSLTPENINQCLTLQPQNTLIITIGTLGNSGLKLTIKCLITHSNSPQRSGYITSHHEQRILKLQSQNFQLKLKLELLNNKVEEQEERLKEITDWMKTEMFRMREQFEGRIQQHSLELYEKSKMSGQEMWK